LPGTVTIDDMANDVAALMDALSVTRAHFLGHALGGLIGLALARSKPGHIDHLVVVNGWARLDPYTARCFDVRLALLRNSGPRAYLRAQPIFLYPPGWISVCSARLDEEAEAQLSHFPDLEILEKRIAALRAWDLSQMPGMIETPVLVLATADDALIPSHAARGLCALLPNHTRMLQFSGGHASNITEPEDFYDRVMPWLAGEEPNKE
jgi:aminoacrylate hydrolase